MIFLQTTDFHMEPEPRPSAQPKPLTPPASITSSHPTKPTTTVSTTQSAVTTTGSSVLTSSSTVSTSDSVTTPVVYYGYDSNETVPRDMCLVGCIFYMGDYLKPDPEICDLWIKVFVYSSLLRPR